MKCPHCSAELPEGSRFCGSCGQALPDRAREVAPASVVSGSDAPAITQQQETLLCTNCGSELPQGSEFCGSCGKSLHAPPRSASKRHRPIEKPPAGVLEAIHGGRTIEAIKLSRQALGLGLAKAKRYVEELAQGVNQPAEAIEHLTLEADPARDAASVEGVALRLDDALNHRRLGDHPFLEFKGVRFHVGETAPSGATLVNESTTVEVCYGSRQLFANIPKEQVATLELTESTPSQPAAARADTPARPANGPATETRISTSDASVAPSPQESAPPKTRRFGIDPNWKSRLFWRFVAPLIGLGIAGAIKMCSEALK